MLQEELARLTTVEERHHRLVARLLLAFLVSLVVFVVGSISSPFVCASYKDVIAAHRPLRRIA